MQPRRIHWRITITSGVGALLAGLGAALAICWDDIFYAMLLKELKLTPTSRGYTVWKEPPMPMFLDFYFFNWTNPESLLEPGSKPHLVEMGPYRFRETREKVNITWHNENSTVSFRILKRWYFDEEGSKGSLDDNVTTLNVVAASAVYSTRYWSFIKQKGVSVGLAVFHQTISVTKTARELLFEGYEDPLLDLAKSLPEGETGAPPVDRFGWFYKRNGSVDNDGYFNMATGAESMDSFGVLKNWNNITSTSFYPGDCGKVMGSAGEFYPPKVSKLDKISLFSPDLCRTITFDFDEVVSVKDIPAYKFSGGSSILDNGTIYEPNKCFCNGECQPSGTLNVSTCRYGSPAFISFPHFYLADPYYNNAVDGLKPDKEKHNFFLSLEPMSSIPLEVAARFQLNILMSPSKNVALYNKVPHIFFPVLWFEQHVILNEEIASGIKMLLIIPLIGNIIALTIFAIGIVVLLWIPIKINVKACIKYCGKDKLKNDNNTPVILNNVRDSKVNMAMLGNRRNEDARTKNFSDDEENVQEPLTTTNQLND